jgi:uncharacterized glyoxalase superfamily protein PhnB
MKFTAPVSRSLPVADIERSAAFYQRLGFSRSGNALENGPARLDLVPTNSAQRQVLFFEVDELADVRGEVHRVNWVKRNVVELRDPDGHVLWFGHSFHREDIHDLHIRKGKGDLRQIMPGLPYADVAAGVAYYRDVLGFTVNYAQHDLAVLDRDSVRLLLVQKRADEGIGRCYMYVDDADALYQSLTSKGARATAAPASHAWGLRDFTIIDPAGNELTFGQPFE